MPGLSGRRNAIRDGKDWASSKSYAKGGKVAKKDGGLSSSDQNFLQSFKDGGAVKLQGGGLSRAQQGLLRGAQELAATSGQNPARLQALTRKHGNLYDQRQQQRASRQMAGNQPGRSAMRGIGPGMKKGGAVKKSGGGKVKRKK